MDDTHDFNAKYTSPMSLVISICVGWVSFFLSFFLPPDNDVSTIMQRRPQRGHGRHCPLPLDWIIIAVITQHPSCMLINITISNGSIQGDSRSLSRIHAIHLTYCFFSLLNWYVSFHMQTLARWMRPITVRVQCQNIIPGQKVLLHTELALFSGGLEQMKEFEKARREGIHEKGYDALGLRLRWRLYPSQDPPSLNRLVWRNFNPLMLSYELNIWRPGILAHIGWAL